MWEETTVQRRGTISEVKRQIGLARTAFHALGNVWSTRDIMTKIKLQICKTLS